MSSVHIDGSGTRPLTFTINDPARTSAQFSTKTDDNLAIQVGGSNIETLIEIPESAQLVRFEKEVTTHGESAETRVDVRYRLVIPNAGAQIHVRHVDEEKGGYPHASISARREIQPFPESQSYEATVLGTVAELLAAAE